jgi:hypothetical protein
MTNITAECESTLVAHKIIQNSSERKDTAKQFLLVGTSDAMENSPKRNE